MGWDAISEGNLIRMYGQDLEVAAACNGLRMVFAIVTLGCAIAYLSQRPPWERITVACSTVVIGVAANVARIVVSGIVSQVLVGAISTGSAHDVAGWLMIPFALILIWCEQRFLGSLFIEGPAEAGARYT
jgi:exosortase